jgi:hypothetical protein
MVRPFLKPRTTAPAEQDPYLAGINAKATKAVVDVAVAPGATSDHLGLYADYDKYRNRIKIDRDRLDEAVTEQPEVFLEVCEQHTMCMSLRDGARDLLARKDSEFAREVRANIEAKGGKATENMVNDGVLLHPSRKQFKDSYEQLKTLSDKWGALRAAFEQRMRMLRELVALYGQGYFTSVTNSGNRSELSTIQAEAARAALDAKRRERAGG